VTWGPLAAATLDGAMQARNEGTLVLTDRCVFLERGGERELLVWPANQTTWSQATGEIVFRRADDEVVKLRDGQHVVLGGGGSSRAEDGLTGQDWADGLDWIVAPAAECLVDVRFIVSDVEPG
jgi:hypothetical protein